MDWSARGGGLNASDLWGGKFLGFHFNNISQGDFKVEMDFPVIKREKVFVLLEGLINLPFPPCNPKWLEAEIVKIRFNRITQCGNFFLCFSPPPTNSRGSLGTFHVLLPHFTFSNHRRCCWWKSLISRYQIDFRFFFRSPLRFTSPPPKVISWRCTKDSTRPFTCKNVYLRRVR